MRMTLRAGFTLLLALLSSAPAAAAGMAATAPVYQFAPVNQYGVKITADYWNPILHYVSRKSGVRLNLKLGRTSADTTSLIVADQVDFAVTNNMFNPERAKLGWSVFARRSSTPVHAQIVVPSESKVTRLAELAGGTVVFPGPESLLSYRIPHAELRRLRIAVDAVFSGNMDGTFALLFSGRARAAGAHSQLVEHYAARENKAFRVLWRSPPFHDLPLMASKRVPRHHLQAVSNAFLAMGDDPQGRRILASSSALLNAREPLYFVAAREADYDAYRRFHDGEPADPR